MDIDGFRTIMDRHVFGGEKEHLLRSVAQKPDRFVGLFRPTKPAAKVLQNLLQSREIRMGDALEELIGELLVEIGFESLPKSLSGREGEPLSLDQYFTDGATWYFVEQKMRDDHDSTKKRGQLANFEAKLQALHERHGSRLVGIMYFIDPKLTKNRNYYEGEFQRLRDSYGVDLQLLYGEQLFAYLGRPDVWDQMLANLRQWKGLLPERPDVNLDASPQASLEEIKTLETRNWRKLLETRELWEGGVIGAIFRDGTTLRLLLDFFRQQHTVTCDRLAAMLEERLREYYP